MNLSYLGLQKLKDCGFVTLLFAIDSNHQEAHQLAGEQFFCLLTAHAAGPRPLNLIFGLGSITLLKTVRSCGEVSEGES
jgi:hypothetical protein